MNTTTGDRGSGMDKAKKTSGQRAERADLPIGLTPGSTVAAVSPRGSIRMPFSVVSPGGGDAEIVTHDELLQLVALGDREALARLQTCMTGPVRRVVQRRIVDPHRSEEAVRETFVDVWDSAAGFDRRRGRATSWILMVAQHRAVTRTRGGRGPRGRQHGAAHLVTAIVHDHLLDSRADGDDYLRMTRALRKLTPAQGEVVALASLDGYSLGDIAAILGIPVRKVSARLHAGIRRVRKELGP